MLALEVIMDTASLHLMLNHVPVLGVVFALAIGIAGGVFKSMAIIRVALGMLVFSAIAAVPVYLTGDEAEEIVEKLPGVSESIIGQHESAALISLVLIGVSGLFAVVTLVFGRSFTSRLPQLMVAATMLVTFLTTASILRTANLGGQIRHTEIRRLTNGVATPDTGIPAQKTKSEHDNDDKD